MAETDKVRENTANAVVATLTLLAATGGYKLVKVEASPRDSWDDFVGHVKQTHAGYTLGAVYITEK